MTVTSITFAATPEITVASDILVPTESDPTHARQIPYSQVDWSEEGYSSLEGCWCGRH